ncbi:MAG: hypothetical protein KAI67_04885 [Candidatus Pacebacteria bacterium]|nr:hypothetical protein [Candidatus Paceibacterota bacterium]
MIVDKYLEEKKCRDSLAQIKNVERTRIPLKLKIWINEYEKLGIRNAFIWKLFIFVQKEISYISIPNKHRTSLSEIQFLITMYIILIDDIADYENNNKLLKVLSKVPFSQNNINHNKLSKKESDHIKFTIKIWERINKIIGSYHGYSALKSIFEYDLEQMINSINYDHIINNNRFLINKTECILHSPHSMKFVIMPTIYLMCLNKLDPNDISSTRQVDWMAQKMLRIGNWISTWEREINEGDFTSGVFAYALDVGIICLDDFEKDHINLIIKKIKDSNVEKELLDEWYENYLTILKYEKKIQFLDIKCFLDGLERVLSLELMRKGIFNEKLT